MTPAAPDPKRTPIQVVLLSLPPRTQSLLEFFFHHAGRGSFIVTAEEQADTAIFDVDTQASRDHWAQFHARTGQPGIALAVKPTEVAGSLWVAKPVTPAALLAAAAALKEGRFNGHASLAPPPTPDAATAAPAAPAAPIAAATATAAAPVAQPAVEMAVPPAELPASAPTAPTTPATAPAWAPADPEPMPAQAAAQPLSESPVTPESPTTIDAEARIEPELAQRAQAVAEPAERAEPLPAPDATPAAPAPSVRPAPRRSLWQRWLFGDTPATVAPPAPASEPEQPVSPAPTAPVEADGATAEGPRGEAAEPAAAAPAAVAPAAPSTNEHAADTPPPASDAPSDAAPAEAAPPATSDIPVQADPTQAHAGEADTGAPPPIDATSSPAEPAPTEAVADEAAETSVRSRVLGHPPERAGMPMAWLFGDRADVTAQQWQDNLALRWDPQAYLVGSLREAALVSSKWQVPTRFECAGADLVVDASRNEVWTTTPLETLLSLAREPLDKRDKVQTLSQVEYARHKAQRESGDAAQVCRLDDLLWRTAMLGSAGRLIRGVDPSRTTYLRQWPNLTRLMPSPHAARLAALWALRGSSVMDSAKLFGIEQRLVVGFHSGVWALNLLTDDGSLARRTQRKSARHRGLLSRLLGWLRG